MSSPSSTLTSITVKAGAGAGKTTNLTGTVLEIAERFYSENKRWPRIVVSTFTRKATQELKERLLVRALKEKPHLVEFVQNKADLVVGTLHGIMDRFLKVHAKTFDLPPAYEIVSPSALAQMRGFALRELSETDANAKVLVSVFGFYKTLELFEELRQVLTLNTKALPISSQEVLNLVESQLRHQMLQVHEQAQNGLTFNGRDAFKKYFEILHEGTHAILENDSIVDFLQLDIDVTEWSTEQLTSYLPQGLGFLNELPIVRTTKNDDEALVDVYKSVHEIVKNLKDTDWSRYTTPHIKRSSELAEQLMRLFDTFEQKMSQLKASRGFVGLTEVELLTLKMAQAHPEVAQSYSEEFDYWLIDEFQDTSPLQVEVLKSLVGDRPTYIVGDPQQSIYLFRGARSQLFEAEIVRLKSLGAEPRTLNKNYRSEASLMAFINELVLKLPGRFEPMETKDQQFSKEPVATICRVETKESEAQFVGQQVLELLQGGVKANKIAVLVRSHTQARDISRELTQRHIPFQLHAGGQFAQRYEIQDSFAFLKFLAHPHDDENLIQLLRSPWLNVDDQQLSDWVAQKNKESSLWEAIAKKDHSVILKLNAALSEQSQIGYYDVYRSFLLKEGLWKSHLVYDGSGLREGNLFLLLARLHEETRKTQFNVLEFIRSQLDRLAVDEGESEGSGTFASDRVHLMTIHASKGLEFDYVFLPNLSNRTPQTTFLNLGLDESRNTWFLRVPLGSDEKSTPTPAEGWAIQQIKEAEAAESFRLFYVAMTRAKKHLFMSWNLKVAGQSWAQSIELDLTLGVHERDNFVYQAVAFESSDLKYTGPNHSLEAVQLPWKENLNPSPQASNSVTALLESDSLPHRILARMAEKAAAGTKVHRLFELLKYPSQSKLHQLIQRWFPEQEAEVLRAVEFVRDSQTPALLEVIQHGEVEWGFATRIQGYRLEGQIDLYGRDALNQFWIVDYKSGTSDLVEKAYLQLEIYALALRTIWPDLRSEKIGLVVVYPFEEKIEKRWASTYDQSLAQFLDLVVVKES